MKKIMIWSMTAFFLGLSGTVAYAEPINKRQVRQQKRIHQGVRSGELTPGETVRLEREQRRIEHREGRFRSDGNFTPCERARTQKMLNRSSRHIYRAKHNNRLR